MKDNAEDFRETTFSKAAETDRPNCPTKSMLLSALYCGSERPNKCNSCRVSADTLYSLISYYYLKH